jgi:hypothetical protein
MRSLSIAAAVLALATALEAPAAWAEDCQSLWVERNSYYKDYGYCFKTRDAISHFGNGGCYINNEGDIRFPSSIRDRIEQIRRIERSLGCR